MSNTSDNIYEIVLNEEVCKTLFPSAFYISYQIVRIYQVLLSVTSMIFIVSFLTFFRGYLKFHPNIQVLFYHQFVACFIQAAIVAIFQTHHFIRRLNATKYCDMVLSPEIYCILHVSLFLSTLCMNFSQVFMILERTLASFFFSCYEKTTGHFGVLLVVLAVFLPSVSLYYVYYGTTFDYPQMSALNTQTSSSTKVNYVFITTVIVYVFSLFHSIFLYRFNSRMNDKVSGKKTMGLSSRYQIGENVISSQVSWRLVFAKLTVYLVYSISILLIRLYIPKPRPGIWQVITELCYTPPIYCAVMPIICIYTIRNSKKNRNQKINSIVALQSTGKEGWDNYHKVLQNQWA